MSNDAPAPSAEGPAWRSSSIELQPHRARELGQNRSVALTSSDEISLRSGQRTAQEEVKWAYPTDRIPLRPPNLPEAWEAKMSNATQWLLRGKPRRQRPGGRGWERSPHFYCQSAAALGGVNNTNISQRKTCCVFVLWIQTRRK